MLERKNLVLRASATGALALRTVQSNLGRLAGSYFLTDRLTPDTPAVSLRP